MLLLRLLLLLLLLLFRPLLAITIHSFVVVNITIMTLSLMAMPGYCPIFELLGSKFDIDLALVPIGTVGEPEEVGYLANPCDESSGW